MELDYSKIGIIISLSVNFFLLYSREKKWNKESLRWILTSFIFLFGIYFFFNNSAIIKKDIFFMSWCLMTPLIFNTFDKFLTLLSIKINNRDFYLWLKGADGEYQKNITGWDRFFSLLLLFILVLLPIIGVQSWCSLPLIFPP